jgi:excisionase family DNA binding protein
MKQKKSPHPAKGQADKLNPLLPHISTGQAPEEEVNETLIAINGTILQKLFTLEDLLKKKDDKPLTFKEACAYLGYAPSYLYKLTYRKVIPHYKPTGKMIFFSKNELDQWIYSSAECRTKSNEPENVKGETDGGSTSSSTGSELQLITKDPNQIEMGFDEKSKSVKREKEDVETEILIEFPLKSRRKQWHAD